MRKIARSAAVGSATLHQGLYRVAIRGRAMENHIIVQIRWEMCFCFEAPSLRAANNGVAGDSAHIHTSMV